MSHTAVMKQYLPRRLIRLRELHRMSQDSLAAEAGIAASTVNELESGLAKDVKLSTLAAIAGALGVGLEALTGEAPMVSGNCLRCDSLNTDLHTLGECMLIMNERGVPISRMVGVYGISEAAIRQAIQDEYEARRKRRY